MFEIGLPATMPLVLGIYGIGPTELIVVGIIVLLLFGNRLPSVMRSLGQSITEFKKGTRESDLNSDTDPKDKLP